MKHRIIPKVEFRTSRVEDIMSVLRYMVRSNWSDRIFNVYPKLKDKLELVALDTDKNKVIYNFFKDLEEKVDLSVKKKEFQKAWNKINNQIMGALEDVVEINWPKDCKNIMARVTLNPVCPRYLKDRVFDIFHNFSIDRMESVSLHELLHFIYFEKWKKVFPKIPQRQFDAPYLVWRLSEMVPAIILKDKRIQNVFKHKPGVYEEFYRIVIGNKPLLTHLQEIYDKKKDFSDFLEKSYKFVKKHEGELK